MANISIDHLADEITRAVQDYTEDVSDAIGSKTNDIANQMLVETGMKAPHSDTATSGQYARGFVKTNKSLKSHGYRKYVIWNKEYYRLVHLLEFGHAKVNGGRVQAYPHMRPVYDKYAGKLQDGIKRIIRNGGGA